MFKNYVYLFEFIVWFCLNVFFYVYVYMGKVYGGKWNFVMCYICDYGNKG